jgi:hypothetical protein
VLHFAREIMEDGHRVWYDDLPAAANQDFDFLDINSLDIGDSAQQHLFTGVGLGHGHGAAWSDLESLATTRFDELDSSSAVEDGRTSRGELEVPSRVIGSLDDGDVSPLSVTRLPNHLSQLEIGPSHDGDLVSNPQRTSPHPLGPSAPPRKRTGEQRKRVTPEQGRILEDAFQRQPKPEKKDREQIAALTQLPMKNVKVRVLS